MTNFTNHAHNKMMDLFSNHSHEVGSQIASAHPGKTPTDCITYIINVLKYAFEKSGDKAISDKVAKLGEYGTKLAAYLVNNQNWKGVYYNPDVNHPRDGNLEHPFSYYKKVILSKQYYTIPMTYWVINYKPTPKTHPSYKNFSGIGGSKELSKQHNVFNRTADRNVVFYGLLIFIVFFLPGCNSKSEDLALQTEKPIISRLNEQHRIVVEFYGELIGPDSERPDHLLIDHILIRDNKTSRVERFIPKDADILQNSFGYFTKVWSPDMDYMVLPLGRFQGFALLSSRTVMKDLQQHRFSETIQIVPTTETSTKLWHEFIGWQKPHLLHFSAGLSGRQTEFVFNPATGEVSTRAAAVSSFKAITKSGTSEVSVSNDL